MALVRRVLPLVLLLALLVKDSECRKVPGLPRIPTRPIIVDTPCLRERCYVPDGRGGCKLDVLCAYGAVAPPEKNFPSGGAA